MPKTRPQGAILVPAESGGTEPIGQRIIETPEDVYRFERRDSRSWFVAYVPVGSIKKGEALAKTGGGGKTVQCGVCHGADLRGLGPVPRIAGRSPSYIVRQLIVARSVNPKSQEALLLEADASRDRNGRLDRALGFARIGHAFPRNALIEPIAGADTWSAPPVGV